MKNTLFIVLFAGFLSLSFVKKNTHALTVQVNGLRNSEGVVLVLLYDKDGTIPDKYRTKYFKKLSADIVSEKATITFNNLPSSTYAVNIIHDENDNGKIDMGFMLPNEGVGFTNFKKLNILNRPSFSKASFELDSDLTVSVKTIYM